MTRGIVYVAWGDKWLSEAMQSAATARRQGYQTCLLTDDICTFPEFDLQRPVDFSRFEGLHPLMRKWACLTETPFESTCFLDTDTAVHTPIDLGFALAEQFGITLTIAPGMLLHHEERELIHYNTGVVFFRGRQPDLLEQFVCAARDVQAARHDGDEAAVSVALSRAGINPAVLPSLFNTVRAGQIHTRRIRVWHSRQWAGTQLVSDQFGNDFTRYDFPWEGDQCPV